MKAMKGWITLLIGIILILPLIGISQLGTATSGVLGWILAIVVLFLGIYRLSTDDK